MADESERTTPLTTITRAPSTACRNSFDTTTLALTDMEQPNIAYGRNYVRLEVGAPDFVPNPTARFAALQRAFVRRSILRLLDRDDLAAGDAAIVARVVDVLADRDKVLALAFWSAR